MTLDSQNVQLNTSSADLVSAWPFWWGRSFSWYCCTLFLSGPNLVLLVQTKFFLREFPGGPVVRTQCLHCRGPGSIPGWGTKMRKPRGMAMWGWTTLTPFCHLHLRSTALPPPLSVWLSFSLTYKDMFPINFYPFLHLMWKLEESLMLTQMVNGPEIPGGGENPRSPSVWSCFSLGSQIPCLALAPLDPPVPLSMVQSEAANASGSSRLPDPSCLCVGYPRQTS